MSITLFTIKGNENISCMCKINEAEKKKAYKSNYKLSFVFYSFLYLNHQDSRAVSDYQMSGDAGVWGFKIHINSKTFVIPSLYTYYGIVEM